MTPSFQAGEVFVALVSAAGLVLAIVFAVRSRANRLETPFSAALAGEDSLLERELFSTVLLERHFSPVGLLLSTALHLIIVAGTPLLPYVFYERLRPDLRRFQVKVVEFRLSSPVFYTPEEGPSAKAARRKVSPPRIRPARRKAAPLHAAGQPARLRPRLELPISTRSRARDVVIQPDQPPDIPIQIPHPLPTAFLWAQGPVPLQETRVVGASERAPLLVFSLPHSDPLVRKPNREAPIGDLQAATPPELPLRAPKLPVFAANVAPVRLPAPPIEPPRELPASALPPGSPMNLIALMSLPAPPSPSYILEVGNRLAPAPAGAATASEAAPAGGNFPKSPPGEPQLEELLESAAAPQPPGPAGASEAAARSLPEAPNPSGPEKPGVPARDPLGAASDNRPARDRRAPTDTARGEPGPRGNLGIIIVRPSPQETEIDAKEVLSGQPVYTVYFDVPGAPRRWILHYCVPGSASPAFVREGDSVVRILPRRSVQPPYPVQRTPVDLTGYRGETSRLMVYALVNERGETENVRLVRGVGHEVDARAVAVLRSWVFRPALRGDSPVAVEALFGIPLN